MTPYTEEQVKDVEAREKKALEMLKEMYLTPAAQISKINLGDDVFGDKLVPFLKDTKYTPQASPIKLDEPISESDKPVEEKE